MDEWLLGDTIHRRAARGASLPPCAICGARTVQIVNDSPRCAAHPFTSPATVSPFVRRALARTLPAKITR